jgi:guanylate kinase
MEELERRLRSRATESELSLQRRIEKARHELTYENEFNVVLINDHLDRTLREAEDIVRKFLL